MAQKKTVEEYAAQFVAIEKKLEEAQEGLKIAETNLKNAMRAVSTWTQDKIRLVALVDALKFSLDPQPEEEEESGVGEVADPVSE